MNRRRLLTLFAACAAPFPALGASPYRAPRTPQGAPDLQGTWTNASYTHLQRPKALTSLVVPPDRAKAYEDELTAKGGVPVPADPLGQVQSEFNDPGVALARIRGEIRSSWIVDPPDGRLPYTAEARKRLRQDDHPAPESFDNVEGREQMERCLYTTGAAPIASSFDASLFQIVQTSDAVVIVAEKNHDARIIRLSGKDAKPPPRGPASWMGDSVGRWEGETLVVVTDNLGPELSQREDDFYLSNAARVEERFTRTGPGEIFYSYTVFDPKLFTRPWRAEMVFAPAKGRLYEYACHEGNYALTNILQAARDGNQPR
jgi:hypothetical protein